MTLSCWTSEKDQPPTGVTNGRGLWGMPARHHNNVNRTRDEGQRGQPSRRSQPRHDSPRTASVLCRAKYLVRENLGTPPVTGATRRGSVRGGRPRVVPASTVLHQSKD
jgi:hypothetical protein